ncbi:hypothetical protein ABEB36_001033 [Hypothenemus hampei]|uniref:Methyltransferase-like protein 22 n=1 Tax=Hypothenemus hampei TaxID=57062 RepID=A0ABD1FD95_HYPHA
MDDIYEITSELYDEFDYKSKSKPLINPKNAVSKFAFNLPEYNLTDKEGDILVPRRNATEHDEELEIEHSVSTSLELVGLQIWRGSLLLADWLLHYGNTLCENEYILELGSGVGLTSIIASMFAPVICTDLNKGEIFNVIKANINRNKHYVKYPIEVMELDFMDKEIREDVKKFLPKVTTVIAADVVYDDHITEAFIKTVKELLSMPPQRSLLVALEKRYVFTIKDCDTCAPCYDYFLEKLQSLNDVEIEQVPSNFPQYFQYLRCKELVLWRISSKI